MYRRRIQNRAKFVLTSNGVCNKKLGYININTNYGNFEFNSVISAESSYLEEIC